MMIYPPIDDMARKLGSKYRLVVGTAKRARQLHEGEKPLYKEPGGKMISIALREIEHDHIIVKDNITHSNEKSS